MDNVRPQQTVSTHLDSGFVVSVLIMVENIAQPNLGCANIVVTNFN